MTGHVDSISPEFASRRDSDENDSIISGDDQDISNFVANSLFRMVLSEQKIMWPVDSSGMAPSTNSPTPIHGQSNIEIQTINWLRLIWKACCSPLKRPWVLYLGTVYIFISYL